MTSSKRKQRETINTNMDYNRFTIDLIKSSFAQDVATGTINESEIDNGTSLISKAISTKLLYPTREQPS